MDKTGDRELLSWATFEMLQRADFPRCALAFRGLVLYSLSPPPYIECIVIATKNEDGCTHGRKVADRNRQLTDGVKRESRKRAHIPLEPVFLGSQLGDVILYCAAHSVSPGWKAGATFRSAVGSRGSVGREGGLLDHRGASLKRGLELAEARAITKLFCDCSPSPCFGVKRRPPGRNWKRSARRWVFRSRL
jgi:hypothetical protein